MTYMSLHRAKIVENNALANRIREVIDLNELDDDEIDDIQAAIDTNDVLCPQNAECHENTENRLRIRAPEIKNDEIQNVECTAELDLDKTEYSNWADYVEFYPPDARMPVGKTSKIDPLVME